MPSPFPGMDPYLEGPHIWEDFHQNLAVKIQNQLTPQLMPKYYASINPRIVYDEVVVTVTYQRKPDAGVYKAREGEWGGVAVAIAPPPLVGRQVREEPFKEFRVEIKEVGTDELITAIEILSPVNKKPGRDAHNEYLRKRRELLRTQVHLMEIDLLRGGKRPPLETRLPNAHYFIFLSRSDRWSEVEIWPINLQDPLPVLPVPLDRGDPDVALDLGRAVRMIYDEAGYGVRIDYSQPPPKPDLSPEDAAWVQAQLVAAGLGETAR